MTELLSSADHERFWSKVDRDGDCWMWTAGKVRLGYGGFWWKGRVLPAHRVAWEIINGPIPPGLCVCHHCDNPPCTNPTHLFLGTHADNSRDMAAKGRWRNKTRPALPLFREKRMVRKLTPTQVIAIRQSYAAGNISQRALGARFGVSNIMVGRIIRGTAWKQGSQLSPVRAVLGSAEGKE